MFVTIGTIILSVIVRLKVLHCLIMLLSFFNIPTWMSTGTTFIFHQCYYLDIYESTCGWVLFVWNIHAVRFTPVYQVANCVEQEGHYIEFAIRRFLFLRRFKAVTGFVFDFALWCLSVTLHGITFHVQMLLKL